MVKIGVGTTDLCFVSCHLTAHEGVAHAKARNASCEQILKGARLGNKDYDASAQFHHCFWFGDLNYRVDIEAPPRCGHTHPVMAALELPPDPEEDASKLTKAELKMLKRSKHAQKFGAVYKVSDRRSRKRKRKRKPVR